MAEGEDKKEVQKLIDRERNKFSAELQRRKNAQEREELLFLAQEGKRLKCVLASVKEVLDGS